MDRIKKNTVPKINTFILYKFRTGDYVLKSKDKMTFATGARLI